MLPIRLTATMQAVECMVRWQRLNLTYAKSSHPTRPETPLYPRASSRNGTTGTMSEYTSRSVVTPVKELLKLILLRFLEGT